MDENLSIETHDGVTVVRDLIPGGTKARFLPLVFENIDHAIYASSAQGGGQVALALTAQRLGKRCTVFGPANAKVHPRQQQVIKAGGELKSGCERHAFRASLDLETPGRRSYPVGYKPKPLVPFGMDIDGAEDVIAEAALSLRLKPKTVWCAGGSGLLLRGLYRAWSNTAFHVVRIGHGLHLNLGNSVGVTIHRCDTAYGKEAPKRWAPFDCDGIYERNAYHVMQEWLAAHTEEANDQTVFWSAMTGPKL